MIIGKTTATAVRRAVGCAVLASAFAVNISPAHAQSAAGPVPQPSDDSLTWKGVTLYGLVDIGLQYNDHAPPFSEWHPAGSADLVAKNSVKSVIGVAPSNLSQSRIGLQGIESLGVGDWNAVFRLETFFNPQAGNISDALKSQTTNAGRPLNEQSFNADSSVAGEIFQQSFVGLSSKTFGSVTFGRQNTLLADGFSKYDPQHGAQAFSPVGLSGTYAGGGATEDKRLDNMLKYVGVFGPLHAGAEYKFSNAQGGNANTSFQFQIGADYLGASVDAYYSKEFSAISTSTLSAAQVAQLPALGYSVTNALAGTISDNSTFAVMGLYNFGKPKVYAAFEHIQYANPNSPLAAGVDTIGGYKLAFVNNTAYTNDKDVNVYWVGATYTLLSKLDVTADFYLIHQNAYGTGKNLDCHGTQSGTCSGQEDVFSVTADYRFSKRFDVYAGVMYSEVQGGLASGFIYNTNNYNPTIGARYKF